MASGPAPETITPDAADGTGVDDGFGVGGGVGLGFGGGVGLGFGEGLGVAVGEGLRVGCVEAGAAQAGVPAFSAADDGAKHTARIAIDPAPSRGASLDPRILLLRGRIPARTAARQSVHTEG